MYLSRIELDMSKAQTRRAVASPQVVHAIVEGCFNEEVKTRKLWRLDELRGKTYLMLLSETTPDFSELQKQLCAEGTEGEVKSYNAFLDNIAVGQKYHFKLCANPTYKPIVAEGVSKVYAHVTVDQQLKWLKGKERGFKLDTHNLSSTVTHKFSKKEQKPKVTIKASVFEGILEVTDKEAFIGVLTQGIGRAKAYGCGLLTVVPVK